MGIILSDFPYSEETRKNTAEFVPVNQTNFRNPKGEIFV
jgi:hypothetical protein